MPPKAKISKEMIVNAERNPDTILFDFPFIR